MKYIFLRIIEKIPVLQILIYNFISNFNFLFPHEKDYFALKKIFKFKTNGLFLDVGGNIGLSTIGFRKLGFSNKILIFEPDIYCYMKLKKLKKKISNIKIFNFGLGFKNSKRFLYQAFFFNIKFHFLSSFKKNYLKKTIHEFYGFFRFFFNIKKTLYYIKRFDELNIREKVSFVKIDVEGFDHHVVQGMYKTIKKNKPVILVEFNSENIEKITNKLKNMYEFYFYFHDQRLLKKYSIKELLKIKKKYNRKSGLNFPRNIFILKKNYFKNSK